MAAWRFASVTCGPRRGAAILLLVLAAAPAAAQFSAPRFDFDLPQSKPGEKWQAGVDYFITADEINPGGYVPRGVIYEPVSVARGKVAVTFFFQYTWDPALEKAIAAWAAKRPEILFVRKPSVGWIHTRAFARMFYTLRALGRAEDLHFKYYEWIAQDTRYEIYHGDPLRPDVTAIEGLDLVFANANGLDDGAFRKAYHSQEAEYAANLAAAESHATGNGGNPADSSILVNGKYLTSLTRVCHREAQAGTFYPGDYASCPGGIERLTSLLSFLVNDELERMKAR